MEVRCSNCRKLFRVSDDKITGSGVKFACTRCHETVKITIADFEQYKLSKAADELTALRQPKERGSRFAAPAAEHRDAVAPAGIQDFDLSDPATAAAAMQQEEELLPEFGAVPDPEPEVPKPVHAVPTPRIPAGKIEIKPSPPAQVKSETKAAPAPGPKPVIPAVPKQEPAAVPPAFREAPQPAAPFTASSETTSARSGAGKKAAVFILLLIFLGGGAFGVKFYLDQASRRSAETLSRMASPEGLHVQNASGVIDANNGDLVITGTVENTTEKPRAAWFVMADVYDAQTTVLTRAKLLNGKQLYTRRDYEIMAKRGVDIQQLKQTLLQEQGEIIPPKGAVTFEIRIMEPPVGVASFNATLQPFDPVQLFKEMAEERK